MLNALKPISKALAGAVGGIIAAALPQIADALNEWVAGAIAAVLAGVIVYVAPRNTPPAP